MSLYIGNTRINGIKLGTLTISAIYAGTSKIFPDLYVLSSYTFTLNETYVRVLNNGGGYRIYVTSYRTSSDGVLSYVGYEIDSYPDEIEVFKYDDSFSIRTTAESLSSNIITLVLKYSGKRIELYVTIALLDEFYMDITDSYDEGVYLYRGDGKVISPQVFLELGYDIKAIEGILVRSARGSFILDKWAFNRYYKEPYALRYTAGLYNAIPGITTTTDLLLVWQDFNVDNNHRLIYNKMGSWYSRDGAVWEAILHPMLSIPESVRTSCGVESRIPSGGYAYTMCLWYRDIKYIYDTWMPGEGLNIDREIWISTLWRNDSAYSASIMPWAVNISNSLFRQVTDFPDLHYVEIHPINLP